MSTVRTGGEPHAPLQPVSLIEVARRCCYFRSGSPAAAFTLLQKNIKAHQAPEEMPILLSRDPSLFE
jgi:hypothetical protein